MGLYRLEKGSVWWMSFSVAGRRYRESTGTEDKKQAVRIFDKVKGQIAERQWFPDSQKPDCTFDQLVEKFQAFSQGRYRSAFHVNLIPQLQARFSGYRLSEITLEQLEKFQSERLTKGKKGKPNKPATVNRLLAVMSRMLNKAVQWDMLSKVPKVEALKEHNKRLRYLSTDEVHRLIEKCPEHLRPIVTMAVNTGMRAGEMLSLKWGQLDLQNGFILLQKTKSGYKREIPINKTLWTMLLDMPSRFKGDAVFINSQTGKCFTEIGKAFERACVNAGIKDFHFHDLRHTAASNMVMAGMDIVTVQQILGHTTLRMTERYSHLAPSHKVAQMEKFDAFMNKKTSEFIEQMQAVSQ
jgi:integrase